MHHSLLDGLAVVVDPLDDNVTGRLVVPLTPAGAGVLNGQRGARNLESEGGLEGRLGLRVEIDAQFLEVGGCCELWVDAARCVLQ